MDVISKGSVKEDRWLRTICTGCYAHCAVRVHRIDGVVVKVEGDPESVKGAKGGVCAKSSYMIQMLYHPKRFKYPVRRTNPRKGVGTDPGWKRITWDEALEEITGRLLKLRDAGETWKMLTIGGVGALPLTSPLLGQTGWRNLFGSISGGAGHSVHCGQASHLGAGMNHCAWSVTPDFKYCNYAIHFGANKGLGSGHSAAMLMSLSAEARARGMKVIAFDPMCHFAGGKADEWLPLIPGTDGIIALAMANVIVNELGVYDVDHLKTKTNAPYLVLPDGRYVRDDTGEPMIWDSPDRVPKAWKDSSIKDPALEGSFQVNGLKCRTVFSMVKEHLTQYTPGQAEGISTVPASTIKRIATEFAENARIGSTIEIEGIRFPYRPVAAFMFRGGQGHTNGFHNYQSVDFLNQLVGAADVPGGALGWPARSLGYPGTGTTAFEPVASKDGFLFSTAWMPMHGTWPHPEPKEPGDPALYDIFTAAPPMSTMPLKSDAPEIWKKFGFPDEPFEFLLTFWSNAAMTAANFEVWEKRFKNLYTVCSAAVPTETTEWFGDIVLPDVVGLELDNFVPGEAYVFSYPIGMLDWEYHPMLRIVEPEYERRFIGDTCLELWDRLDLRDRYMDVIARWLGRTACPRPWQAGEKLSWDEMTDRVLRARFGDEHDLEWFRDNGFMRWKKRPEEAYWRWQINARASIYHEWLVDQGVKVKNICQPRGYELDWKQYVPLISYFPAASHQAKSGDFDLFAFGYRDILHNASTTQEIPWLFEVSEMNPFTFNVVMNSETAREKGIEDMDEAYLENEAGQRIKVKIHTTEGIHPRCIAMAHGSCHWLKGHPAEGKSGLLNALFMVEDKYFCPISQSIETSVRVKVYKGVHR
ncbi:MAG: molybdopterin-dependent oxidoreductase [Deltaproteobacteria bacterium]|nr:molybdopterin-dependent oxidoreductase [Deltaproteobacteria bacterium]MBW2136320.1 molybdopterin-dependent oxidoreductase [Deltaproteobacteria bacterium]